MYSARGHDRCRYHCAYTEGYPYLQERLKHATIQMQQVKPFPSLRKKVKDMLKNGKQLPIPSPTDLTPPGLIPHHSQNDLRQSQ